MLTHWDEVESRSRRLGHLAGSWYDLGRAAGTAGVGLKRIQIPDGLWSTPAHVHGRQEEIFYVLTGSGLSWQDGDTYEIGPGDCLVHLAGGRAHTLQAGPDGLDVLAFGMRGWDEAPTLTRAGAVWLGEGWVVLAGEEDHPWKREVEVGPPELPPEPSERPASIVNVVDAEEFELWERPQGFASTWRNLGEAAGSVKTGIKHIRVEPGNLSTQHHCHSVEEELFVVLEGEGTLELVAAPLAREQPPDRVPVRAGHVVSRPPGTRVAHAFRAGDDGLALLAYGTRDPGDLAYYPLSSKIYFRGLGVITRVDHIPYWDGVD